MAILNGGWVLAQHTYNSIHLLKQLNVYLCNVFKCFESYLFIKHLSLSLSIYLYFYKLQEGLSVCVSVIHISLEPLV